MSQEHIYLLVFDKGKKEFNEILNTSPDLEPIRHALREANLPLELQDLVLKGVRLFVPPRLHHAAKVLLQKQKDRVNARFYSRHVVVSNSTRNDVIQSLGKFGRLKKDGERQLDIAGTSAAESERAFQAHLASLRESGLDVLCTFLGEAPLLERRQVTNSTIPRCDISWIPSSYINPRQRVLRPSVNPPGNDAESASSLHSWLTHDPWEPCHAESERAPRANHDAESVSSRTDSVHSWRTFSSWD